MANDLQIIVAQVLHDLWVQEQVALGYHLPQKCPNYEHNRVDAADMEDMIHCKRCNGSLLPYDELDSYSRGKLLDKSSKLLVALAAAGLAVKRN